MDNFYITTPIYYVNGEPHLGHAYTTIVADVFARHFRQRGAEVFFMTGTDEHGLKVQRAAEEQGKTPQQLADENSAKFRELFEQLRLTHDRFIRTTDAEHHDTVREVVRRMKESGDIYLGKYEGWYAASDEAFYDEAEIDMENKVVEGTSTKVEWVEESSYFFRLSAYEDRLLEWYRQPGTVEPKVRCNEVASFVEGGLNDLSISRTTFDWGIPFPDDPEHVLYVWVDALTNYITGVGAFRDEESFEKFWPCDVHLIGKDILRFHAVYWPAFLMSAGIEPPKQVFAHGWWMVEGHKMSKSLGNYIGAFELAEMYADNLDVLRYFLIRELPLGGDGNFARLRVAERLNNELADNLGNLVNRTMAMTGRFLDGELKGWVESDDELDVALREAAEATLADVCAAMDARESHRALERIMTLSQELNQYVQRTEPWKLRKDDSQRARLEQVLYNALEGMRWVAVLAAAFLPDASRKILEAMGVEWGIENAGPGLDTLSWGGLPAGTKVEAPPVLFEKADLEALAAEQAAEQAEEEPKKESKASKPKKEKKERKMISFKEFQSVEMRVGQIREAGPVEGADKLLLLKVDVGEDAPRQVVAGIAKSFAPDELVGRKVAVVTNLEPAKIFGHESQAMLLAADRTDGGLELTRFGDEVAVGTRLS